MIVVVLTASKVLFPNKKFYSSVEELQEDADQWMRYYNEERSHSGRYCYGKTPMETFRESKPMAKAKEIDNHNWWSYNNEVRTTPELSPGN